MVCYSENGDAATGWFGDLLVIISIILLKFFLVFLIVLSLVGISFLFLFKLSGSKSPSTSDVG